MTNHIDPEAIKAPTKNAGRLTAWVDKDYLEPAVNQKRRDDRLSLEHRLSEWQSTHPQEASRHMDTVTLLPRKVIQAEIDRRLALELQVKEMASELLELELERRNYESLNRNLELL